MNLLFFIWALRMININFSVNPCHLWCPVMSWKIPVNLSRIFFTLLSRLTFLREFILPKTTFNRTFSIFESYCYSITTVIIWIFLFFVRIILWLELNVWWYRNIRALILFLLYLNRFLLYRFFCLLVLLSHNYTRGNTLPSFFIFCLISLLSRPSILRMCNIHWLHWFLAILTMMDSFTYSGRSWLRIEFILINYTSLTFIHTTYVTVMWTSNN